MQEKKSVELSKIQVSDKFTKLYEQQQNSLCFECDKKSKQWAECRHGIFLCLTCAARYKQLSKIVEIKSIGLDNWTEQQILILNAGGNRRFKQFLQLYSLNFKQPQVFLKTKAAQYYRRLLKSQVSGSEIEQKPAFLQGQQQIASPIVMSQITPEYLLEQAKQTLCWAGEKTKYYGNKAFEKVQYKITSGQLKQDAIKAATVVGETAQSIWSFIKLQIQEIQK